MRSYVRKTSKGFFSSNSMEVAVALVLTGGCSLRNAAGKMNLNHRTLCR